MSKTTILCKDGGFATQLSVHVGERIDGNPLWSARFNATDPDAVVKTHLDFLKAGADIILTNTYQASVEGYMKYLGVTRDQSIDLIKKTVQLAHKARETFLKENSDNNRVKAPLIVASIGPYGAHLHDGSEYTGSYADFITSEDLRNWHRIRIDAVLAAGVDALAIETIPCQVEAESIIDLLCDEYPNVKFWISLQCKDGSTIAHGEVFKDVCLTLWDKMEKRQVVQNCLALGVNCLNPQFVTPLFESLNGDIDDEHKIPLVVYPNSGEIYDVKNGWTGKENCVTLEKYVPTWINLGAKIIGGCCRTYARDVYKIKECIKNLEK
ncbi:uncharacterized protein LOC129605223 isoform X2 [Condylostylus longicornis]|uniref:uncharacterized protein LOC129605223 isoform X2 n=1 Tax=Condylostylus longicornis TaxID=2530218 RepID=UPI00244E57EE|nr:uncharacterized protein LOC129605223 isoform X2 [Condylostylus longicornis]